MNDKTASEQARIDAARHGDEQEFAALTQPLRRELLLHCYRMLGMLDDADDALQETLLRSWRHLDTFESRASFRAWLYRIATNVCLTMLQDRAHRNAVVLSGGEVERESDASPKAEPMHLQPFPDRLLLDRSIGDSPAALIERREDVELAFVAAVQTLPPRQRAALLLRDVIGYPAAEVATMLETSVAAVNSALQRAHTTLDRERISGTISRVHTSPGAATEQVLVARLVAAWHAVDVPAIVAILTEDALFAMPPLPQFFIGRAAIAAFLAAGPADGRLDRFRMIPTRANGQPALASYYRDSDEGPFRAHGIIVLSFRDEAIASICRFGEEILFPHFALPPQIDD